ncbi:alcohol dehydrogenase catalytic domain-containing protein [Streptomyces millisiae]|uniref:Alcohol dehydrogenase catalytic domain-containing protein n=1 Tax=Streptomyces millisiae TaxID=3075542 RepID=A0ABU2LUB0_9ACTN|nr:alcohol dehydrogenase catalytic domain-containing protein [Streptomyces sp. DSM 44918]MDT0321190.1 alcohol dehydrogenase catalytic domain-containing protein [Streptomyces sp. DSM 44918]
MRAAFMYGAGDVRVEHTPGPIIEQPSDAIARIVRAGVCGSNLHPYHNMPASEERTPMGHEFLGVVEELGSEVSGLSRRHLVVTRFAYPENTRPARPAR